MTYYNTDMEAFIYIYMVSAVVAVFTLLLDLFKGMRMNIGDSIFCGIITLTPVVNTWVAAAYIYRTLR